MRFQNYCVSLIVEHAKGSALGSPASPSSISVKKKEVRRENHCESKINGVVVKDQCQISCDFCFEPVQTCFNDAAFLSQEFEGIERSCKNIRLDESHHDILCQFDDVRMACPQSCRFCCGSDATYCFKSVDNKTRTCEWISRRNVIAHQYRYCNNFLNGATVRDKCSKACHSMPSCTPSKTPTKNPTKAPTAAETFSPVSRAPVLAPVLAPIRAPVPLTSLNPSVSIIPSLEPSVSVIPYLEPTVSNMPSLELTVSIIPSLEPSVSIILSLEPTVFIIPSSNPSVSIIPSVYSNNSFENGFQGWTLSNLFGGANSAEIICNPAGSIGRSVPDGDCYAKLVGNVSNT